MILENRPGLLVEMHMLKDYKTRVTGNYEILRALLEVLNRDAAKLIALNKEADAAADPAGRPPAVQREVSACTMPGTARPRRSVSRLSIQARAQRNFRRHVGQLHPRALERYSSAAPAPTRSITSTMPPAAYIVPPQWTHVIDVLAAHRRRHAPHHRCLDRQGGDLPLQRNGVARRPRSRAGTPSLRAKARGGQPGRFGQCTLGHRRQMTFPAGSVVVR